MTQLLDDAADALDRQVFFDRLSSRWDELRVDVEAWAELEAERDAESQALHDGALPYDVLPDSPDSSG